MLQSAQRSHPNIKTFRVRPQPSGWKLYLSEGHEYQVFHYDAIQKQSVLSAPLEMAAEHTGGAVGDKRIGAEVQIPDGAVVLEIYYAGAGGYKAILHHIDAQLALES